MIGASNSVDTYRVDGNSSSDGTKAVLHAFMGGGDGENPYEGLVRDEAGNLYGTTSRGGAANAGTVFKLAPDGTETVLYAFMGGSDGALPVAGVIADKAANLYGTTYGSASTNCGGGCGTIFKLASDGTETVLHSFTGGSDGWAPEGGLIEDKAGNLNGSTELGGNHGREFGTIFKLDSDSTKRVLHVCTGEGDCAYPDGDLIKDDGILFGTSAGGGARYGAVFKLIKK